VDVPWAGNADALDRNVDCRSCRCNPAREPAQHRKETTMAPTRTDRSDTDEDAVDLLASDHDAIAELFDRYEVLASDEAPADERRELAEEICTLLLVHGTIKEEIFYPAARELIEEEYLIDEALVAQDSARAIIDDIQAGDPTEPRYDAQVRILHELVAQHFDEERAELFPRVRQTSLDLEEVGAELAARQEVLLSADEEADAG
jgi:hemerythrin superfamily protein